MFSGSQWLKGQYAVFPQDNDPYRIVFEGIVGKYVFVLDKKIIS